MVKFWKQDGFKTLQKDWYERLKSEGFYDIETISNDEPRLKRYANYLLEQKKYITRVIAEEYFRVISDKIRETEFKRVEDELILIWHADGERIKTICQRLLQLGMKRNRQSVRFIIRRYEMLWGLRNYTRRQLNLDWPRKEKKEAPPPIE